MLGELLDHLFAPLLGQGSGFGQSITVEHSSSTVEHSQAQLRCRKLAHKSSRSPPGSKCGIQLVYR